MKNNKLIFDRNSLRMKRDNALSGIRESLFIKYGANDIIERLKLIDNDFSNILDIGCRAGHLTKLLATIYPNSKITATDMSDSLLAAFDHDHKLAIDEEKLEFPAHSFDLITYSLGLNWINDIQTFLNNIRNLLKPTGIFIGNFVGDSSFRNLRTLFIREEMATNSNHFLRISPFIRFDDTQLLLTSACFSEVVVDYENIEVTFDTPLELMQEIQKIAETNSMLHNPVYTITKKMFAALSNRVAKAFTDQITVISFIASPTKGSIKIKVVKYP